VEYADAANFKLQCLQSQMPEASRLTASSWHSGQRCGLALYLLTLFICFRILTPYLAPYFPVMPAFTVPLAILLT
jgi:hypothetical protein